MTNFSTDGCRNAQKMPKNGLLAVIFLTNLDYSSILAGINWPVLINKQCISRFIATRRYLDQVTKKHLQTHKVQYFQAIGLENFQIEWPPKQNLHYLEGVKILLLCKAPHMR